MDSKEIAKANAGALPQLSKYLRSDDKIIKEAAEILEQYISGGMTKSEIIEVTRDIFDLTLIEDQIDSIERKILLKDSFDAMLFIVSFLPI